MTFLGTMILFSVCLDMKMITWKKEGYKGKKGKERKGKKRNGRQNESMDWDERKFFFYQIGGEKNKIASNCQKTQ